MLSEQGTNERMARWHRGKDWELWRVFCFILLRCIYARCQLSDVTWCKKRQLNNIHIFGMPIILIQTRSFSNSMIQCPNIMISVWIVSFYEVWIQSLVLYVANIVGFKGTEPAKYCISVECYKNDNVVMCDIVLRTNLFIYLLLRTSLFIY